MKRSLVTIRYLLLLLLLAAGLGAAEVFLVHQGFGEKSQHLNQTNYMALVANTFRELYPDRPLSHYIDGALLVRSHQNEEATSQFELALEYRGTEENLLYDYAANLVATGRRSHEVESAVKAWRFHFPKSNRPDPRSLQRTESLVVDSELYIAAINDFRNGDYKSASEKLKQDIAAGSHTEQVFYNYALTLVLQDADADEIATAVWVWRQHYPNSIREDPRSVVQRAVQESASGLD